MSDREIEKNEALARIKALEAELREADTACFKLCTRHGFATGHGDTVADMIGEIDAQISTRIEALEAQLLDNSERYGNEIADRIEALEASLAEWKALAIQWAKDAEAAPEQDK